MHKSLSSRILGLLFILPVLSACQNSLKKNGYEVYSTKKSESGVFNTVILPNAVSKDSTIEIARRIRSKSAKANFFVCYFYLPGMVLEEFAWAAVEYSNSGGDDKDKDGTRVKYELVFPNYHSPKELLALKSTGYDHKNLIKEVPDVVAVVKYEFYKDPGKPNEGVMVVLYPDGRARSVKFKIKQVDGKPKYVFTDPKTPGAVMLKDHDIQIFQEENGAPWRHIYF